VGVDAVPHRVDQPDDQLGHGVARRGLAPEDHRAGRGGGGGAVDEAGGGGGGGGGGPGGAPCPLGGGGPAGGEGGGGRCAPPAAVAVLGLDDLGEPPLVVALHRVPALGEGGVGGEPGQPLEPGEVGHPRGAPEPVGDQRGQTGVGLPEPAPRRDAVGLVAELV